MADRLTPLDASFLHVESPTAHMHVGWRARFVPDPDKRAITVDRVRALVASRLHHVPRLRQRLAFPPGGFGAPVWVDAEDFDIVRHVMALGDEEGPLPRHRFEAMVDGVLSVPLERGRPLWEIHMAPALDDGTAGVVMKVHHAMVDGLSAVALTMLLLDVDPGAQEPAAPSPWAPRRAPNPGRLAIDAFADAGMTPMRVAGRALRDGPGLARSLRRAALAVGEDVLRTAPDSYLNASLGPRRTLAGHVTDLEGMLEARAALGVTLNDVALCVVTGALRQIALLRNTVPAPMKAMVPVARRSGAEAGAMGNKIAFVSVELPLHERKVERRLDAIRRATTEFKAGDRAAGSEVLLDALGVLPPLVQARAARLAASPRAYNLVVSNVPGPRVPVYLLGARGIEAFPVVPLSDRHALSIGILSLADRLCFGGYGDPEALSEIRELPGALAASVLELRAAASGRRAA